MPNRYLKDPFIHKTLQLLHKGVRQLKTITLSNYKNCDSRLYYRNKLVIPNNDELKIKIL